MENVELHIDGLRVPKFGRPPAHIAVIMDGNGRWAKANGMERTEGHKRGELVLMDVVAGAIEAGIKELSLYTFSTENWNRSPSEVRFLMGFSRDIIHQRTALLNEWGVKIQWCGRVPKLWKSVLAELRKGEELTKGNSVLTLNMCINYGSQQEIVDAANKAIESGAKSVTIKSLAKYMYLPKMRPVDLLIRTSGEMRISNFLLFQIAYAELVFNKKLWPEFSRRDLWDAIVEYEMRNRTYGR